MQKTQPNQLIRFGVFEVDPRSGELRSKGSRVKLQDQPLQILLAVLEKPGEVVTREELRAKLWPADTFVDFDHGLNAAVKRLRDALGDTAENPRYIETLPRRGYRFIAETVTDAIQPVQIQSPSRRWVALFVVAFFLVIAGLLSVLDAGGLRSRLLSRSPAQPQVHSLAVLPLTNLSGDPQQEYFSDGMTEALTADLAKFSSFRVTSRTSAMRYKDTKKSLQDIARELSVDAVVEGSVMRSGNRVRITTQFIDARTDRHLWGETYERDLGDVLILEGEVAQAIAQRIQARLTPQQQAQVSSASTVNPDAYESYLKGRYYETTTGTPQGIKKAQNYFEDAIRRDPSFAGSYVGLAACYLDLGTLRRIAPQDAYRSANEAIRKALQIDGTLGEAHIPLGYLIWQFEWDWRTAEKEFRYGVETSPNYLEGLDALTWFLAWSGRSGEALKEITRRRALDPADPAGSNGELAINYHRRDYKALLESSRAFMALNPDLWLSHYFLAVSYDGLGRQVEAIPEYQRAVELSEADTDTVAGLAHAYSAAGRRSEAEKILRDLLRQSRTGYVSPYMIAAIYASLGDKDRAFEFLEKAHEEKSPDVVYFLRADLRLDSLRSDPRFQDLLRRMNFPR